MHLKNVLIVVKDIELSKQFYKDVLGFGIIRNSDDNVMLTEGLVLQSYDSWKTLQGMENLQADSDSAMRSELFMDESCFDEFVEKIRKVAADGTYNIKIVNDVSANCFGTRTIRIADMDGHLIEIADSHIPSEQSAAGADVPGAEKDVAATEKSDTAADVPGAEKDVAAAEKSDTDEIDGSDDLEIVSLEDEIPEKDKADSKTAGSGNTRKDTKSGTPEDNGEAKKSGKIGSYIGRTFAVIGITLLMMIICFYFAMFILIKGPSEHIRDLLVLSLKESSVGGILADIYLSPDEIAAIQASNSFEDTDEITDTSIVRIGAISEEEELSQDNGEQSQEDGDGTEHFIVTSSYDKNVYVEDGIEFHEIEGSTFTGIMAVVADPSRVFIGSAKDYFDGSAGLSVPQIAEKYGAILATNGAFFDDTGGVGNGGIPLGFVFSEGSQKYGGLGTVYNMMGFNQEGVLICGRMTGQQAVDYGIRDGLSCNPFLIINGEIMNVNGTGGGLNPRTALGQRADGAVLMLVIDGRQATSLGASMLDVADVMYSFGAVNAGNLDGGGSTVLYYKGEIVNVVMSLYGARGIPDAVCVRPEEN